MKIRPSKKNSSKKNASKASSKKAAELAHSLTSQDYAWVKPLAKKVGENATVISIYLSEILAKVAVSSSIEFSNDTDARWMLIKNITKLIIPSAAKTLTNIEKSITSLELALGEMSAEVLRDSEITRELLVPAIEFIANTIEANPRLVVLLGHPEILSEGFGEFGKPLEAILSLIPALSQKATEALPDLREILFSALFKLTEEQRIQLYQLSEEILQHTYKEYVFPQLEEMLSVDPRGQVLAPILKGAIEAIPGESCLNAVLSMAATVRSQLTIGRIIAIAIQKLGGLYVKISQVIAELSPPSLARELRTSQDDAGGLFPSTEQSWNYLLRILSRDEIKEWQDYIDLPVEPQEHFASASIGALYELKLNKVGQEKFGTQSVLIKLQRPGLHALFRLQSNHLLKLCDDSQALLLKNEREKETLSERTKEELLGIIGAIRRAILNYYKQSASELDFTFEKSNAIRVASALDGNDSILVPKYFSAHTDVVIMERMPGTKITRIVQSKYLARREIADSMTKAYLDLLFDHGVVWADPHPGNILYDDVTNKVSMIDLNPCFVWSLRTRENFKHLLYRLLLSDSTGVYKTLYDLVDNPEALQSNRIAGDLDRFLNTAIGSGSLIRFVGEFIKTLNENGVDLKIEVQAALRGLSQLALTAASVSARNSFGFLLRRHFRIKEMLQTTWQIGPVRAIKILTGILFELTQSKPEEDVGPVLDERDLAALSKQVRELSRASVCEINLVRINPEDHPNLKMSTDESILLVTSDLHIEIIEKNRPATVRYIVEIPTKIWLKERQEFVKLASVARNFCIIESLEQLRRNSLDDYWRIVEAWNKPADMRTLEETRLTGEIKNAARRLYAIRFAHIWGTSFTGISWQARFVWKLLITVECWREEATHKYLRSMNPKFANVILANLAFGTFYRIKMLIVQGILWLLRQRVKSLKYLMHLLPMSTENIGNLILFGLSRKLKVKIKSG